jgi:transcription initiation factor IIE alpha subunit
MENYTELESNIINAALQALEENKLAFCWVLNNDDAIKIETALKVALDLCNENNKLLNNPAIENLQAIAPELQKPEQTNNVIKGFFDKVHDNAPKKCSDLLDYDEDDGG